QHQLQCPWRADRVHAARRAALLPGDGHGCSGPWGFSCPQTGAGQKQVGRKTGPASCPVFTRLRTGTHQALARIVLMWNDIPWNPTRRTLRQFAVLWLLFFGLLTLYQVTMHDGRDFTPALVLGVLGVLLGPLGIVRPEFFRPLFVGSMVAAFPFNYVTSRLILGLIFYCLFMSF